ncbi:MAG TPA: hypothetical protein VGN74_01685 [Brevundimonas sp.]|jgi:hypothetical protein|uniref:hypothetical protein n=1 Tax=Brevundimonas sp. TaxID=1871086 RepID=UPI002E102020|nr:hypothetical protein [Brevundimonas sp.]
MRHIVLAAAGAALLLAGSAAAQSGRTLDTFVTEANRVPMNPTAMLRADARRLVAEYRGGMRTVVERIRADRAAGRTPPACPPDQISVNPREMLAFLNGIPQPRRAQMSVTDGIQAWMASRYPCAG